MRYSGACLGSQPLAPWVEWSEMDVTVPFCFFACSPNDELSLRIHQSSSPVAIIIDRHHHFELLRRMFAYLVPDARCPMAEESSDQPTSKVEPNTRMGQTSSTAGARVPD